jgi:CheY-like chemotaxis protein
MQIKLALVVDDSKSARFSLKKLLQKQGIESDFAESAGDALNYLESRRPDIIFMDHLMPGMDGFDATKAIKNNAATADIPVIMCTSKEGSDYAEQAMATGAYAILPKPAPEATLMAVLNQLELTLAAPTADLNADASKQVASSGAGMGQRAVESMVKKMLDDSVTLLRKNLGDSLQAQVREHVELTLAQTRDAIRKELSDSMDAQINTTAQKYARQIASELFDQRFDDLANHVQGQIIGQIVEIQTSLESLRKPSPELLNEVKNIAQFTAAAAAGEAAKVTAADTSQRIFDEISRKEIDIIKASLAEDIEARITQATGTTRLLAIAALVIAIGGVVAAFVL